MKKVALASTLATVTLALVLDANAAKAALEYNIYESLGNLVVETSGSLNLPASAGTGNCGAGGAIAPTIGFMCTGPNLTQPVYLISGPSTFTGTSDIYPGTSVSGLVTGVVAGIQRFVMESTYVSGSPIVSGATFTGVTLADLGLTPSSGTLGTWTLAGTGDTIAIKVVNPVPGPLPVLAAGAAFGFSRCLRQRIKSRQASAQS
ncbi:MAG: hypothetical protein ACK6BC_04780 [Cyanobacteriota bacterium]